MSVLIFNGTMDSRPESIAGILANYLTQKLDQKGIDSETFHLSESGIPLFDPTLNRTPKGVEIMNAKFQDADAHIWLSPLYHGSIPGVMKNCLDWMELTSKNIRPYLSDKIVGMVCWADGVQAMQGINAMEAIAKSLRAWPVPYSVPLQRASLIHPELPLSLSQETETKLNLLLELTAGRKIQVLK